MSITKELRMYVQDWRDTPSLMDDLDRGDVEGILADFIRIADRIDKEHAEAVADALRLRGEPDRWVKLPVDADGVPIHVGDELTNGKVARLLICDDAEENSVYVYESPHVIKQIYCYEVVHRKPDSWEGIISDAVILGRQLEWLDNSRGDAGSERELVERCRRLAGEGE